MSFLAGPTFIHLLFLNCSDRFRVFTLLCFFALADVSITSLQKWNAFALDEVTQGGSLFPCSLSFCADEIGLSVNRSRALGAGDLPLPMVVNRPRFISTSGC